MKSLMINILVVYCNDSLIDIESDSGIIDISRLYDLYISYSIEESGSEFDFRHILQAL